MRGLTQVKAPPASDSQLWCSRHHRAAQSMRERPGVLILALAQPAPRISRDRTATASTSGQPQEAALNSIAALQGASAARLSMTCC